MSCYCDYDSPELYNAKIRKSRKKHKCDECGGPIFVGEKYEDITGKWEGEFSSIKTCQVCHDFLQWVKNNVPCLCYSYGNLINDCEAAIEDAVERAPDETKGLTFGFLRRKIERRNALAERASLVRSE